MMQVFNRKDMIVFGRYCFYNCLILSKASDWNSIEEEKQKVLIDNLLDVWLAMRNCMEQTKEKKEVKDGEFDYE